VSEYVVDASVAAKWYLDEIHTDAARELLGGEHDLHAPDFLLIELDNVFCKHIRRGEMSVAHADSSRAALRRVPMRLWPTGLLQETAYSTAVRTRRSVYDCLYVALAMVLDAAMVTADRRLVDALADGPAGEHLVWVEDLG